MLNSQFPCQSRATRRELSVVGGGVNERLRLSVGIRGECLRPGSPRVQQCGPTCPFPRTGRAAQLGARITRSKRRSGFGWQGGRRPPECDGLRRVVGHGRLRRRDRSNRCRSCASRSSVPTAWRIRTWRSWTPVSSTVMCRSSSSLTISPSACAPVASRTWTSPSRRMTTCTSVTAVRSVRNRCAAPKNRAPSSR